MRLTVFLAVCWPETRRLETQKVLFGDVACLDAEDPAGVELFPHDWKYAASTLAMQNERFTNRAKYVFGLQRELDGFVVKQEKVCVSGHGKKRRCLNDKALEKFGRRSRLRPEPSQR